MSTEPDPEPLTPDAIVRRASMMGLCSQTHHEHLMRDAATVRKATLAATPSSVTPDLRDAANGEMEWLDVRNRQWTRENVARHPDAPFPYRAILPLLDALDAAALASVTPSEPTLDADRLATAICASREPPTTATADLFVDDDCRRLARLVAAQYESMAEDARSPMGGPA